MKIKYKEDKKSLSPSYSIVDSLYLLNNKDTKAFLRKKTLNGKIARICLHKNKLDKIHQMIIFQKKNYVHDIKRHPRKEKLYLILSGSQIVKIYDNNKKKKKTFKLNNNNFICKIPKNTWHNNMTVSKESLHIEIIEGPFNRSKDSIYFNK